MGKKRIFEIAKEYGVKSPEIIELLAKHNISKTNFSSVDDSEAAIIHAALSKKQALQKPQKPQTQAMVNVEKAKPAVASAPVKPRPEKTERPSMIVKPVIMTVETNAEGKSTITHNALQKDKTAKPVPTESRSDNRNAASAQIQTSINDGKNKYRNAPNNKLSVTKEINPAADTKQPFRPATVSPQPNVNRNVNQNRTVQSRPVNAQGMSNRPDQGQGFNRQGGNFNRDRQNQGQNVNRQGGGFNRERQGQQGQNLTLLALAVFVNAAAKAAALTKTARASRVRASTARAAALTKIKIAAFRVINLAAVRVTVTTLLKSHRLLKIFPGARKAEKNIIRSTRNNLKAPMLPVTAAQCAVLTICARQSI